MYFWLHGLFGAPDDWQPLTQALPDQLHHALTLPGHCGTPPPTSFEDLVQQTHTLLLDQLPAPGSDWTLAGYSLGGRVALALALALQHTPNAPRRLILESASPGLDDDHERANRAELDRQRAHAIRTQGLPAFLDDWYQLPLFRVTNPETRRALIEQRSVHHPDDVAQTLEVASPGRAPTLWPRLPELTLPTLYLTGARDHAYERIGDRIRREAPQLRHVSIPNAGHNTHRDQPTDTAHAIRRFREETP